MKSLLRVKQLMTIAAVFAALPVFAQVKQGETGNAGNTDKTVVNTTDAQASTGGSGIGTEIFLRSQRSLITAQKNVKAGLPAYSGDGAYINKQVQYIRSAALLGDHFLAGYNKSHKVSDLQKAMKYYDLVTTLSSGTDSDLGDNLKTITERNNVCRKVANLFNNGTIPLESVKGIYARHAVDITKVNFPGSFTGSLSDVSGITVRFIPGNAKLTADAKNGLKELAVTLKNSNSQHIVVSCGGDNSYLGQQLSWEHVYVVVQLLTENGVDSGRFLFMPNSGTGNLDETLIRFAAAGEDGPALLPPPAPGIWGN